MKLTARGKAVVSVAAVLGAWLLWSSLTGGGDDVTAKDKSQVSESTSSKKADEPSESKAPRVGSEEKSKVLGGVDLSTYSHTKASSIWVVANKKHPLNPERYVPELETVEGQQVAAVSAPHLRELLQAARTAGVPLQIVSAYRSYDYQVTVYGNKKAAVGQAEADRWSARPGHSEHQTGLAVDLSNAGSGSCVLEVCFGDTAGGKWLAAYAHEFGYIIRYTEANQDISGYNPEPWHLRFVGEDLAKAIKESGTGSLEEVFGVSGGDYDE